MNIPSFKISTVVALLQITIAVPLWHRGLPYHSLLPLLLPIVVLVILEYRYHLKFDRQMFNSQREVDNANVRLDGVRRSANRDSLTGLHTQHYIRQCLNEILDRDLKPGEKVAVLYLDLDFFKEFNEALGHAQGDRLLASIATRLSSMVKKGDQLGYYGGDEFIILLPHIVDVMAAELVAKRILNNLIIPVELNDQQVTVSASIGISVGPGDGHNSETLISHAASALKNSKEQGRRRYSFYGGHINELSTARLKIDQQLRVALQQHEFSLVYQPIISDRDRRLKGFEALIRWNNAELGRVSPAVFIPIAEEIGLITEIGNWVIQESCQQLKAWQSQYSLPLVMSINVSPRQFQDGTILPALKRVLTQTGIKPETIQLEVTEGVFLVASERTFKTISLIKQIGFKLALDDFGTGYSSLAYLNQLPFDVLKVDKSFIDGLCDNVKDRTMVHAIITLAHALKMEVVVEGVESVRQLELLRDMSSDLIQGYYYSRPICARDVESQFLKKNAFELNETIWDFL